MPMPDVFVTCTVPSVQNRSRRVQTASKWPAVDQVPELRDVAISPLIQPLNFRGAVDWQDIVRIQGQDPLRFHMH